MRTLDHKADYFIPNAYVPLAHNGNADIIDNQIIEMNELGYSVADICRQIWYRLTPEQIERTGKKLYVNKVVRKYIDTSK